MPVRSVGVKSTQNSSKSDRAGFSWQYVPPYQGAYRHGWHFAPTAKQFLHPALAQVRFVNGLSAPCLQGLLGTSDAYTTR